MGHLGFYSRRSKHENHNEDWVELQCIKEFLISQQVEIYREIESVECNTFLLRHQRNILIVEFQKRLAGIENMLDGIHVKIKQNEKN